MRFAAMFTATMAVGLTSHAGGVSIFHLSYDYGDGFIRVQKTSTSTSLDEVRMPSMKGTTTCKSDGWRVMRVGPLDAKPYERTVVSHSWTAPASAVTFSGLPRSARDARKKKLAAACSAKHAAVKIGVQQAGMCICNKSALCGGKMEVKKHQRLIDFAIDCQGFGTPTKKALWMLKYYNTYSGKKQPVWRSLTLDVAGLANIEKGSHYTRAGVDGQIHTQSGSGRKALYSFTRGGTEGLFATVAADANTIAELKGAGFKQGKVLGYIDGSPGTGRTPLYSYYRSATKDWVVAAETRSVNAFKGMGYTLKRVEGYVMTVPNL